MKNDLTGMRFGRLVVLGDSGDRKSGYHVAWECICDCGNKTYAEKKSLVGGFVKSCGCLKKERTKDLTGQKFGLWNVIKRLPKGNKPQTLWEVKCDCGTIKALRASSLIHGESKSCGCNMRELAKKRAQTQVVLKPLERRGFLTIVKLTDVRKNKQTVWECLCDCGKKIYLSSGALRSQISCGCLSKYTGYLRRSNGHSGYTGVTWNKDKNKWKSYITAMSKQFHLGYFLSLDEAISARKEAEEQILKGEFNFDRTRHSKSNQDSTVTSWDDLPY